MIESTLALPTNATAMLVKPVFFPVLSPCEKALVRKASMQSAAHKGFPCSKITFRDSSQIKKDDMIAFFEGQRCVYGQRLPLPLLRQDTNPGRWEGTRNYEKICEAAERDNPGVSAGGDARLLPWGLQPESSSRIFPQTAGLDL